MSPGSTSPKFMLSEIILSLFTSKFIPSRFTYHIPSVYTVRVYLPYLMLLNPRAPKFVLLGFIFPKFTSLNLYCQALSC